mmetsp:Transcript_11163/g.18952  ORF Transcript_11163/g.18952 Transcript_11163/m.18952 type:complete len:111 (+) Transcript_11163:294-626(+)
MPNNEDFVMESQLPRHDQTRRLVSKTTHSSSSRRPTPVLDHQQHLLIRTYSKEKALLQMRRALFCCLQALLQNLTTCQSEENSMNKLAPHWTLDWLHTRRIAHIHNLFVY